MAEAGESEATERVGDVCETEVAGVGRDGGGAWSG